MDSREGEMKGAAAGLSGMVALALLLPMEAGVPIPLPADLVMLTVGERVAAGRFPLWLAVVGFEVIAVLGTTALFLACRGPAHRIIARFGPRLGLTQARVRRAAAFAETRGRPGPGRDEQPEAQPVMRRERTDRMRPV
jgi:membrane protein DedA with SNARE-associated domain